MTASDLQIPPYREPLGLVNSGGSQNCPDLSDREEAHIASIWATRDRSKMGDYDGPPNSPNLMVRGIAPLYVYSPPFALPCPWDKAGTTALKILKEGPHNSELLLSSKTRDCVHICLSDLEHSQDLEPAPLPSRENPVNDKSHIVKLIAKLDETPVYRLIFIIKPLADIGENIKDLHPLSFMKVVLEDRDLKTRFQRIFDSFPKREGWMHGTGSGFADQFERENGRNNLKCYVPQFAASFKLEENKIMELIQARRWTDLVSYLIAETCLGEERASPESPP
jgi:hypothetical protein